MLHTYTHTHVHVDTYTHIGCMTTRDTMTVRSSGILYHTLGRKNLTGQGQNRTEWMEKKGKQITSQADASVQVRSYTSARRMRRRVRMTVRLSGLLEHPLGHQRSAGEGLNRAALVKKKSWLITLCVLPVRAAPHVPPLAYVKPSENDFATLGTTKTRYGTR